MLTGEHCVRTPLPAAEGTPRACARDAHAHAQARVTTIVIQHGFADVRV